jgi:hypothetical protein
VALAKAHPGVEPAPPEVQSFAMPDSAPPSLLERREALLFLALECEHVLAGPSRYALRGIDRAQLGRGDERAVKRKGSTLSITVADSWMSARHALLIRIGGRFILEDRGSKNGTRVNGRLVMRSNLADGDVIEIGRTLFLFRELDLMAEPPADLERKNLARLPQPLQTLSPTLAREIDVARACRALVISGEPGTGKQVMARALHRSSRRAGRLIVVDCARPVDFKRLVRTAERGTLLLREPGALRPAARAELAEALSRARDVAWIGCTRRALSGAHQRQLQGQELELPALRQRKEDLGLLLHGLLRSADRGYDWAIEPDAARLLLLSPWPDNLRQLDRVVRESASRSADGLIRLEHLSGTLAAAQKN